MFEATQSIPSRAEGYALRSTTMSSGSTARSDCSIRLSARDRKAAASSNVSGGTRRWTQSGVAGPRLSINSERPPSCPADSYLGTEGILNGLNVGDAFFNKLGATISERTFCDLGSCTAYFMTIGPSPGMDPESFKHSKYIILWACNTISTNLHHWPFIAEAKNKGAKLVVIDPFKTRTAREADWHIPIRPGTDAALALGLMNVIIGEDLVDHDYVQNYTTGFDELKERVSAYPPEMVAKITGIPGESTSGRSRANTRPSNRA